MSLTSYRAAPSRDTLGACRLRIVWPSIYHHLLEIHGLFIRFGGDLLSHTLRCSTIGAKALNGRVRNGSGCFALAMTTKPNKESMLVAVGLPPGPQLSSKSVYLCDV